MFTIILIALVFTSLVLGGIGDGLFDAGKKAPGKLLQDLEIMSLLLFPLVLVLGWMQYLPTVRDIVTQFLLFFGGYICVRFSIFDYLVTLPQPNVKLTHIGTVGWYARLLNRFKAPWYGWLTARIVFLTAGIKLLTEVI